MSKDEIAVCMQGVRLYSNSAKSFLLGQVGRQRHTLHSVSNAPWMSWSSPTSGLL